MKVPVEWLKEFVPIEGVSDEELARALTMAGLEVEEIHAGDDGSILETKVTPNRGDWLSIFGVARELAAVLGRPLMREPQVVPLGEGDTRKYASAQVSDPELCPRYCAKVVRDVRRGETPEYIQRRLTACGMRPIGVVVDITNYVMLELGQPLHAFDYDTIPNGHIVVRPASVGEKLKTLDGVERALTTDILVIADEKHPIALAGVMGGAPTEVSGATKNILLEAAHFNPQAVRRAAKALGLSTEASYRFERYVDPSLTSLALERAADLIAQYAGGEPVSGRVDTGANLAGGQLSLRVERVRAILGLPLTWEEIVEALSRLQIKPAPLRSAAAASPAKKGDLSFTIPPSRPDIVREIDLIEEIGRVVGYETLPETLPPARGAGGQDSTEALFNSELREIMVAEGLTEALNHSLAAPSPFDDPRDAERRVKIRLALSAELSGLRISLLPHLLENLGLNLRHREPDVRLYEIGKVYRMLGKGNYWEGYRLACVLAGEGVDFFAAKGVVENVLSALFISSATFAPGERGAMHPGRTAQVTVGGQMAGFVAELDPDAVREHLDVPASAGRVACFELDVDLLRRLAEERAGRAYQLAPKFPSLVRDLAMLYDRETPYGQIEKVVAEAAGERLESIGLLSVYTGEKVAVNKKSVAVRLTLRAKDRTLADADADSVLAGVQKALASALGAVMR